MVSRSPDENHRAATPLELFFDLVFVVAIAQAAAALHHAIIENHAAEGLLGYVMAFFAIWWAWMQFTWFASAYDTDDVPYRIVVFVQLTGALILAAGISEMAKNSSFLFVTIGYVVMRLAMVAQWRRAARANPERRPALKRYMVGTLTLQAFWVALLWAPSHLVVPGFFVLVILEWCVPIWAEKAAPTTWHAEHVAERFGLLTIIVLGETILAATLAIQSAIERGELTTALAPVVVGGLLLVFSAWWLYFLQPTHHHLRISMNRAFAWGYGHLVIFGSAAGFGAGLAVAVDHVTGHSAISDFAAGCAVAIPAAIYLLCLWCLHDLPSSGRGTKWLGPLFALVILSTPYLGQPVLGVGVLMASFLTLRLLLHYKTTEAAG